jgi:hypothetical protein
MLYTILEGHVLLCWLSSFSRSMLSVDKITGIHSTVITDVFKRILDAQIPLAQLRL